MLADRAAGGRVLKITRTVVAGHPLGGSYRGRASEHFHDRGSAHDKSLLKIMSFDCHISIAIYMRKVPANASAGTRGLPPGIAQERLGQLPFETGEDQVKSKLELIIHVAVGDQPGDFNQAGWRLAGHGAREADQPLKF